METTKRNNASEKENRIMTKFGTGTTIEASEVEQWKWGYVCPECGGEMEPSMDEPPIFDKLNKQALEDFECRKCGTMWSALYNLASIQKEIDPSDYEEEKEN